MTSGLEPIWNAEGEDKRARVQSMFSDIAPVYDRMNGVMSLNLHQSWRKFVVNHLKLGPSDIALDLCCGTGDFAKELIRTLSPRSVIGIDFCPPMLRLAKRKVEGVMFALGDASCIPMASGSVSVITVGWGIRNVPDIHQTHKEIFRVLAKGGRFASLDMAVPRNPIIKGLSKLATKWGIPTIGRILGKGEAYTYLPESTTKFLGREGLKDSMESAGFRDVWHQDMFVGNICAHFGVKP